MAERGVALDRLALPSLLLLVYRDRGNDEEVLLILGIGISLGNDAGPVLVVGG